MASSRQVWPLVPTAGAPKVVCDVLVKARTAWLKVEDVVDILRNYRAYGFPVSRDPPDRPPGGSIFLFDRRAARGFRRDGHAWRTKADGRTVRETHERLRPSSAKSGGGGGGGVNCFYAHADPATAPASPGGLTLQRRCFVLLEGDAGLALVQYLDVVPSATRLARAARERAAAVASAAAAAAAAAVAAAHHPPCCAASESGGPSTPGDASGRSSPACSAGTCCAGAAHAHHHRAYAAATAARLAALARAASAPSIIASSAGTATTATASTAAPGGTWARRDGALVTTGVFDGGPDPLAHTAPVLPVAPVSAFAALAAGGVGGAGAAAGPTAGQQPPLSGLTRAATTPASLLLTSAPSIGPLHAAPSFDRGTVQTGETLEAAAAAAASAVFGRAGSGGALPPPPPPPAGVVLTLSRASSAAMAPPLPMPDANSLF